MCRRGETLASELLAFAAMDRRSACWSQTFNFSFTSKNTRKDTALHECPNSNLKSSRLLLGLPLFGSLKKILMLSSAQSRPRLSAGPPIGMILVCRFEFSRFAGLTGKPGFIVNYNHPDRYSQTARPRAGFLPGHNAGSGRRGPCCHHCLVTGRPGIRPRAAVNSPLACWPPGAIRFWNCGSCRRKDGVG